MCVHATMSVSEYTAEIIDEEARAMVKKAYDVTLALLRDKYDGLKQVSAQQQKKFTCFLKYLNNIVEILVLKF